MKEKTVLQKLIEEVEGVNGVLDKDTLLMWMTAQLPAEKQQIAQAYNRGFDNRAKGFHDTAEMYYNNLFTTKKEEDADK